MRHAVTVVALVILGAVVVRPLWRCEYPPLTDLPEHALAASVIAHRGDPAMRYDEVYAIDLFGRPTAVFYLVAAALTEVLPLREAVLGAVAVAMLSVPLGLYLLLLAARKDPALAVLGIVPLFGTLLHWGFVNYLLAAGVYLGTLAAIVHDLESPRPARAAAVVLASLVLFFTHVWGVVALAVTGVPLVLVAGPRGGRGPRAWLDGLRARLRGLAPLVPCGLLSIAWWAFARPPVAEGGPPLRLALETKRAAHLLDDLSGGLSGTGLADAMRWGAWAVVAITAIVALDLVLRTVAPRWRAPGVRPLGRLDLALLLVPLIHLGLYLVLPMDWGGWWFVYPREAFFVAATVPAALPAIAVRPLAIAAVLAAVLAAPWPADEAARRWPEMNRWTAGFDDVVARIPRGAGLMALVSATRAPGPYAPLLHFGAWANALRGGHPAWSFAVFGASPVYHPPGKEPPALPRRWEWTATSSFRFDREGRGWEHFLVGHAPIERLFRGHLGRDVEVVIKRGEWAYVHRVGITARPAAPAPARRRR